VNATTKRAHRPRDLEGGLTWSQAFWVCTCGIRFCLSRERTAPFPFFQMHRYTLLSFTAAAYNTTSSPPLQTGTSLEIIKLERDTNLHAGTTKAGSVSIVRPWFISTVVRFRRPSFHKNTGHTPTTPTINTCAAARSVLIEM
jgi:hypothetical protein